MLPPQLKPQDTAELRKFGVGFAVLFITHDLALMVQVSDRIGIMLEGKLVEGKSLVTADMVSSLETLIDEVSARFEPPREFVVPGQTVVAAHLDLARTVVRRAERLAVRAAAPPSQVVPYLNRLSDLLFVAGRVLNRHAGRGDVQWRHQRRKQ